MLARSDPPPAAPDPETAREAALEAAFAELLLSPGLHVPKRETVEQCGRRHGIAEDDMDSWLDGDLERLWVYRNLVRNNFRSTLELGIPRTRARLGALFEDYLDPYLALRACHSHQLRDVTEEFLAFSEKRWKADTRIPEYLWDLARHEAALLRVAASPEEPPPQDPAPLDGARGVQFISALALLHYSYAVHELPESLDDPSVPVLNPGALLVYRDASHEIKTLELTPLAAGFLQSLLGGASLAASLHLTLAEPEQSVSLPLLEGAAKLLADLAARGVVLGAARPQE